VPAGVDTGDMMPIKGEGEPGLRGGPYGDLYVQFKVRPHPLFERKGNNTYCDLPLTFTQAALGADVEIPTIDGKVTTRIREGTQPFDTYTLRGKGIPLKNRPSNRGDHICRFVLEVPTNLSEDQKETLRKFENTLTDKNYQKRNSFFGKLKDLFGR
ncbi:MAG: molecular chaperone DnaJ, partial [Clostridiales bacterium]|nr:molecular chaperone DnaJ [Clostridiales bacterium]